MAFKTIIIRTTITKLRPIVNQQANSYWAEVNDKKQYYGIVATNDAVIFNVKHKQFQILPVTRASRKLIEKNLKKIIETKNGGMSTYRIPL